MNVLVVDDKKSVRDNLSRFLQSRGYLVDTAENGLDGFEKAQKGNYQLFIVDHLMPLMNGVLLSNNIRNVAKYIETPILFITTQPEKNVTRLSEFSLFNKVLSKPVQEEEFVSVVEQLLLSSNNEHSSTLIAS